MHVKELTEISSRLHRLQEELRSAARKGKNSLDEKDPLVEAARACEFMLPSTLTVGTLAQTVEKKISTVNVLLERARRHESLPEDAQVVADQEYLATDEDYHAELAQQAMPERSGQAPAA